MRKYIRIGAALFAMATLSLPAVAHTDDCHTLDEAVSVLSRSLPQAKLVVLKGDNLKEFAAGLRLTRKDWPEYETLVIIEADTKAWFLAGFNQGCGDSVLAIEPALARRLLNPPFSVKAGLQGAA